MFLTLLSFHIDHSQQARMYTFLVFFYSCTLWALIRAVRDGQRWHWATYLLAASLMSYTQGIGILYVATIAVLFPVISSNPYKVSEWIPFVLANLMVFVLFIPWLIVLSHAHFRTGFLNWVPGPTWISVPGTLFAFICRYIPFTSIPYSGHLFILAVAVAAAMVPALALFWIGLRRAFSLPAKWAAVTAASTFVLPIVLVFLLSVLVTPMYIDRVLLPAAVGFVLILGASVAKTKLWTSPPYRWIAIVLAISCLNVYYYFQYREREDFRSLSAHLQLSVKPGQSILFVADSGLPQFLIEYYDPEMKLAKARKFDIRSILRSCQKHSEECLDAQTAEFKNSERLWIVYAHDTSLPDRQALQHWLDTRFLTISTQSYTLPDRLRLSETKPSRF
jgi:4-amino-4-deoxy-L-arabinose transferase-like glycosyltransferase